MKAVSPTGTVIIGTLETTPGTAGIAPDSFRKSESGELEFDYSGGTKTDWDGQESVRVRGEALFEDEEGGIWPESAIKLVE